MNVWEGVLVCVKIVAALVVLGAAAALFILITDKGEDCCDRHSFDLDDTVLPVEEAS